MVKKLLIEDTRKKPTSHGDKNKNKEACDARLDFSATNNGKMTRDWMVGIKKKVDILPDIYQRALMAAGITAKQLNNDMDSDFENDRANIESETDDSEEDGLA